MTKADNTRRSILLTAFDIIYKNGYQVTSIDDIIASTKVTKGAFYYHFKSKDAMGLAVIREVMQPGMHEVLVKSLENSTDPVNDIYDMMKAVLMNKTFFDARFGCPAVNLIDEMAPVNKSFSQALGAIMQKWQDAIRKCIDKGKSEHKIRKDVNAQQVAYFIAAGYGGIRNMGKIYGEASYTTYLKELKQYLKGLQ